MKPTQAADEMFPEGPYMDSDETGSSSTMTVEISPERFVHTDFKNGFGDLYDDDNLD